MKNEEILKNSLVVISLSGGLDSTSLLIHLLKNDNRIRGISFNYGQKHIVEIERLQRNISYLNNVFSVGENFVEWVFFDLKQLGNIFNSTLLQKGGEIPQGNYNDENMKSTVVPNRNAIFSSIMYGYALSLLEKEKESEIYLSLGVHAGDHTIYPDCRPEFYNKLFSAFEEGNWNSEKVFFYLPFLSKNKIEILEELYLNCEAMGINFNTIISNTSTCYTPDFRGRACGKCGACTERLEAFKKNSLVDSILYV